MSPKDAADLESPRIQSLVSSTTITAYYSELAVHKADTCHEKIDTRVVPHSDNLLHKLGLHRWYLIE